MLGSEWLGLLAGNSLYLAAFAAGLFGGVAHCSGMCGGIITAISLGQQQRHQQKKSLPILLGYNIGRISSYAFIGLLVGASGELLTSILSPEQTRFLLTGLSLFTALLMIALGLYLANLWHGISLLERFGRPFWRRIEPLSRRFLPVRSPLQAIPFGMIWGWLPCGLVYSMLFMSLSSGNATEGALIMLAFGLGTLPTLMTIGLLSNYFRAMQSPWWRKTAGAIIFIFGLLLLTDAITQQLLH